MAYEKDKDNLIDEIGEFSSDQYQTGYVRIYQYGDSVPKFAIERRDNENKYKSPGRYTLEEGKILPGLIAQATARIEELLIK